jgi:ubiquinone/menaquinone biosynthesis C-methylase UbiE
LEKDERQVAEWYDALSGSYDELYGKEQSQKHQAILEFLGNRRFQVLIDIGCGTGTFLKQSREIYDYAIGIDLSRKMLEIAKKRKAHNTDYILASSSSLPIRNASSDCTVSISIEKAEPNLGMLISGFERIGREDSFLVFTLFLPPGAPNPPSLPNRVRSTIISKREALYFLRLASTPK